MRSWLRGCAQDSVYSINVGNKTVYIIDASDAVEAPIELAFMDVSTCVGRE